MQPNRIACLFLLLGLTGPATLSAGVYNLAEPPKLAPVVEKDGSIKPLPFGLFRDTLNEESGILALQQAKDSNVPPDKGIGKGTIDKFKKCHDQAESLKTKVRGGSATLDERVQLSSYLIWLGKNNEAIELLEPLARGEARNHCLLLTNLATAYQLAGQLDRAGDYLEQARDCWPAQSAGLSAEQLKWYGEVEKYQLRLVRLRRAEAARAQPGARSLPASVDALFGDRDNPVRFVGDNGRYQAGTLAAAEKAKLPKNAVAIVQQLVLWMPTDTRLYWLLGELLNAQGKEYIKDSYQVLDDCLYIRSWAPEEIKEHRRILLENLPKFETQAGPATETGSWVPDTPKLLLVGGAAFLVIGFLGYFQVRELWRRRG